MIPEIAPVIADALAKARLVTISGDSAEGGAAQSATSNITSVIQTPREAMRMRATPSLFVRTDSCAMRPPPGVRPPASTTWLATGEPSITRPRGR